MEDLSGIAIGAAAPENPVYQTIRHLTASASDQYDEIKYGKGFNTDALFNEPAPEPWVSFMIGGIFSAIGILLWMFRCRETREAIGDSVPITWRLRLRCWISAAVDNDDAAFTIVKMAAQSFIFLGGLQLNYELAFIIMLGYFGFESCADSFRVISAFREAHSMLDVVVTSKNMSNKLRNREVTQLKPTNVYEDLTRNKHIVFMVFATQCILISFVVVDIFDSDTTNCRDGTRDCPVAGTFGSWGFYLLGIFMACVFLLGPKTNFGQSEQNPAYWLKLLLIAKTRAKCTWYDSAKGKTKYRILTPSDWRIWTRFFMSFLINGVGFHILVHALPIQVASQSTLTGVVFRAVGMMYLVDLDDTSGYTMTLVEEDDETEEEKAEKKKKKNPFKKKPLATDSVVVEQPKMDEGEVAVRVEQIIADAHAQLDALGVGKDAPQGKGSATGSLAIAGGVVGAGVVLGTARGLDVGDEEEGNADGRGQSLGTGALGEYGDAGDGEDGGDGGEDGGDGGEDGGDGGEDGGDPGGE